MMFRTFHAFHRIWVQILDSRFQQHSYPYSLDVCNIFLNEAMENMFSQSKDRILQSLLSFNEHIHMYTLLGIMWKFLLCF